MRDSELQELKLDIDPRVPAGNLGIGRQQLVEIAKALSQYARILVLDEPTAELETEVVADDEVDEDELGGLATPFGLPTATILLVCVV